MAEHVRDMLPHHQVVVNRFVTACEADDRVVAAFLGGSYASGQADAYSDLDLYVITRDDAYDAFLAAREEFVRRLGEPLFLEVYHGRHGDTVCCMLADGTEADLELGRRSRFEYLHGGALRVLVDKQGVLAGVSFAPPTVEPAEQTERLRGMIVWFWHNLRHHVLTPLARGQMWSAYGGLEDLRRTCVDLVRLDEQFAAEPEAYERVEQAVPIDRLEPLRATCCPLEREPMLAAARTLVQFYSDLAPGLAQAHGIAYPAELAHMLSDRLRQMA